jgi:hypothetical protein
MYRALTAAAIAALAAAPVALSQGQKSADLTIDVKPNPITFGQSTTVSGMLKTKDKSGQRIELQARPAGDNSFNEVASTTSATSGAYSFTVKPDKNTAYRVVARTSPPIRSAEPEVSVRFKVSLRLSDYTPSRCERVRFSGSVQPEHDGRVVYIQRRTSSGSWRGVGRTTLADAGTTRSVYAKRIRVCRDSTFRARVVRDADHATGDSRARSANVP